MLLVKDVGLYQQVTMLLAKAVGLYQQVTMLLAKAVGLYQQVTMLLAKAVGLYQQVTMLLAKAVGLYQLSSWKVNISISFSISCGSTRGKGGLSKFDFSLEKHSICMIIIIL